jgi:RNA polymerase sigma-70 factor (sigma-E family)
MGRDAADAEFEQVVRASWPQLRQAAFALTGSAEDAEDLLQGVLVRTYARWGRVRRDNPVAYIRRALVNAYVDQWRRRKVLTEQPTEDPPDRADRPASAGESRIEDRDDLAARLRLLSPRERAMVVLRYYFDHSEAEVAEALGCSVGTVKSTCSRALARLRVVEVVEAQEETR